MITDSLTATMTEIPAGSQRDSKLWELAKSLESTFLEEMLSQTGLESSSAFGGGIGEEQFTSFLTKTRAEVLTQSGGIGLAKAIYDSLVREESQDV